MLSRWRKEVREGRIVTKGVEIEQDVAAELKELRRVKKQYERLKLEHEILKKAIAFTSDRGRRSSSSSKRTGKTSRSE
jgi:transposase